MMLSLSSLRLSVARVDAARKGLSNADGNVEKLAFAVKATMEQFSFCMSEVSTCVSV
jgi:hypothetical protein